LIREYRHDRLEIFGDTSIAKGLAPAAEPRKQALEIGRRFYHPLGGAALARAPVLTDPAIKL
jgi:hypothetical protein